MKVSTAHVDIIRSAVTPLDTTERRQQYIDGKFPRADKVKDLDKRYRWDLLWASFAVSDLYDEGYNDSHIDTALRSIVPALQSEAS